MGTYNKHLVILGSARSGTSWLAELLARPSRYRLLFEPEHPDNTPKGHLICDRWIAGREEAGKGHGYFKKILANRVDNNWIAQHSNRRFKRHLWPLVPRRYIIKFVRCNLALPYFTDHLGVPVLYLVRDPFQVIASQMRVGFPWLYDLSYFKQQPELVKWLDDTFGFNLEPFKPERNAATLAVRWSIENSLLPSLAGTDRPNLKVIRYNELRDDPGLFPGLCDYFGLEPVDNWLERMGEPSSKTHPKSSIVEPTNKIQVISGKEQQTLMEIFRQFKLNPFI